MKTTEMISERIAEADGWARQCTVAVLGCAIALGSSGVAVSDGGYGRSMPLTNTPIIACSPEPTAMDIAFGSDVTCSIDVIGDTDLFRFPGTSGDVVVVQTARNGTAGGFGSPELELFDPVGTPLGTSNPLIATLPSTGTYSVLVSEFLNNDTVDYTLAVERIAPPVADASICVGCTVVESIGPIGELDVVTFSGRQNDVMRVQVSQNGTAGGFGSP